VQIARYHGCLATGENGVILGFLKPALPPRPVQKLQKVLTAQRSLGYTFILQGYTFCKFGKM
jgi:hypothetical protein